MIRIGWGLKGAEEIAMADDTGEVTNLNRTSKHRRSLSHAERGGGNRDVDLVVGNLVNEKRKTGV